MPKILPGKDSAIFRSCKNYTMPLLKMRERWCSSVYPTGGISSATVTASSGTLSTNCRWKNGSRSGSGAMAAFWRLAAFYR